jgi:hypothetical protein
MRMYFKQINHLKCYIPMQLEETDALPNSLTNSNISRKVKMTKERVRIRSLARSTLGVRGVCWSSEMGTRTSDKRVNYSHRLAQTKQVG